jgi:uncharacterized repeat protein (TIGR04138 family)
MLHWLPRSLLDVLAVVVGLTLFVLVVVVGLALGVLLLWQAIGIGVNHGMVACSVLCAGVVPILFALFAAHELGHWVAGWAMGLPFVHFTAAPVVIARKGGWLRARLNIAWFRPTAFVEHGLAWRADGPVQWAITVLGGPLANLVLGVACLSAASWHNPGPPAAWRSSPAFLYPGDLVTAFLNIGGMLSLALCFVTLAPSRAAGASSDGDQLLQLWLFQRAARAIGCPVSAVLLVNAALAEISARRRQERGNEVSHVSAQEFCNYLLVSRGKETTATLRACNIRCSEDVGRIIFGLIHAGLAGRRESDTEADFRGLFVLE